VYDIISFSAIILVRNKIKLKYVFQ